MTVSYHRVGRNGFVVLSNPPVNAIGQAVREGLLKAVEWAENEGLERVILSGAGKIFAAGGDAREFDAPPVEPHLPDVLARIERSNVIWIAAINGAALGGGAELMLACRYRIAVPSAQIGLPEVTLGVVPGAGGTQRLPRLVGLKPALEMISTGKNISAAEALQLGLIDAIDEDAGRAAEVASIAMLSNRVAVADLPGPAPDAAAVAAARAQAAKKTPSQIAPQRAIDLVEASATLRFAAAMQQERQIFLELRQASQARALRHVFFAERGAKVPAFLAGIQPPKLSRVAVVGGGTMGAAIAYALLAAGLKVWVLESDPAGIARATANIEKLFSAGVARGIISDATAAERRGALEVTSDYSAVATAELAIEAAFEDMAVKHAIFAKLEAVLAGGAILATNTSYLDVNQIAAKLSNPARLVGLHFFAPAHIMKLLEIVQGSATSPEALALGFDLARRLRKIPVLAGVCDGFIGNRILQRYRETADTLLLEGALPWEVDAAIAAFGYAMGPYEAQDLSGLDIAFANRRRQDATRDPSKRYVAIADRMVEAGRLGRKTGAGWYSYAGGSKQIDPAVEQIILAEAARTGTVRRSFDVAEITRILLAAMIDEAKAILAEGIAHSASDIDLVTVYGYGFPRWRGGLMHYAAEIGAE